MIPKKINITKIDKSNTLYKKGKNNILENAFMSDKRKKYFINNYNNLWKSNHNNTNIYLFLKNNNIQKWKKDLKIMFWRVNFMRELVHNKKQQDIWIYPSNYKKTIPKIKNITTDDINSGCTISYLYSDNNGTILIWRKEELLKVLLHELIHSFKIDTNYPNPIEAYTELNALYTNIYLELLERKIPLTKKNINKYINYEKIFSIEQSKKINKCTNDNTNIYYYINEKSKILHNIHIHNKEWDNYVEKIKITKPFVSNNSLRFTITDYLLKNKPRILFTQISK